MEVLRSWIEQLSLIDHHCHSVLRAPLDEAAFGRWLTEALAPAPDADPFDSALGLALRRWCPPVLDLPANAPAREYLDRRAELDPGEVTRRMLAAAGVTALLVDHGLSGDGLLDPDGLATLAGVAVDEVVRLESVAEAVADAEPSPAEYPDAVAAEITRRSGTAVGCKSILAYRHGFDLDPTRPDPAAVRGAAERWLADREAGGRLSDPVLLRHALWCGLDTGLPLQLHTGLGDPDEDLHRANPILLTGFARATVDSGVPLVLLHCWPYHREAAWLAHVFPHVHLDIGLAATYVGPRAGAVLAETLELAPFGKLLYSSDAYGLPELYLVAARGFRRALAEVLGAWVDAGDATCADARRIAAMITADNAGRLYRLPGR
jgi:predicted TIM-barrel fold metal-dependent hydrolase